MSTFSQQASAVETARRIVVGAAKPPKPSASETKLLAEHLRDAAETLRNAASQMRKIGT